MHFDKCFITVNLVEILRRKGIGSTDTILKKISPKGNNFGLRENGRGSTVFRSDKKY